MDPARSPIFVIGIGRSGTTLLRLMLCAHPRIYITHEASFYLAEAVFRKKAPRREYLEAYMESRTFRWLNVDPERIRTQLPDPLPSERIGVAYAAMMREKAAQYGRVRFGDKTPAHSAFVHKIFRDFPEARVVRIVRDPRSNVESLMRVPFGSASVVACAALIETERKKVLPFRERMLTIRLEDLLGDGRKTMGQVLDYVGEPWDDAVLDHSRHLPDACDMPPQPWLTSAAGERTAPTVRWKSLSARQIRLIERVARGSMKEGGYERAVLPENPGWLAVTGQWFREMPEAFRYLGVGIKMLIRGNRSLKDDDEGDALTRRLNPGSWARYPTLNGRLLPEPPPLTVAASPPAGDDG